MTQISDGKITMKARALADKKNSQRENDGSGSGTVGKALGVLDVVARLGRPVRASEIQAASDLPKGTLYRFLQTLTEQNMLSYDPDRRVYFLGVRLVSLAQVAWRNFEIAPVARPHLDALAQKIDLATYLSKLDGGQCVSLERGTPEVIAGVFHDIDRIYPAYCTAVGKAMLANLPEDARENALTMQSFHPMTDATITDPDVLRAELTTIRDQGYAIEDGEHVRGIIAVAVPILSPGGALLGGIGVHAGDRRTDLDTLKRHIPDMQNTAAIIARDAAEWRFPDRNANWDARGESSCPE
ncbi:putative HTH-type transcriptional regulator RhmR [Roseivivax sp. THAF40]|nr:putative HTH-type transcriptional regulator RhmR [Roseivivax sp. THAF197b]QFT44978.1 putative HTH-type transcriptional regulator RhmR [Roseivivax sp. THAF40]